VQEPVAYCSAGDDFVQEGTSLDDVVSIHPLFEK